MIPGKYKITYWTSDEETIIDAGGEFQVHITGECIDIKLSSEVRSIVFERPYQ